MIQWTEPAQADFLGIAAWIREHDSRRQAERVGRKILLAVARLESFPASGRVGRVPETRELVVSRLPYVVVYSVEKTGVVLLRILHGAMQWPSVSEEKETTEAPEGSAL